MRNRRMDRDYRDRRDGIRVERTAIHHTGPRQNRPAAKQVAGKRTPSKAQRPVQKGQRNQRRRQMEAKRRQGIFLVLGLMILLAATYGVSKLWVTIKAWEGKAEKSTFVVSASQPQKMEDEIINVALFGTDADGFRADVNMVASFNTRTKALHLVSVPRDTRVTMTQEMTSFLEQKGRTVPERNGVYGQCKLTEVHAYAGEGNRTTFSVKMLEEILGIQIDYYVKVDLSAFRDIVDAVGGVDFNVAERLYYVDPYQDLYIDLYPGEQHLDGAKAEQLVRFREGYAQKDLKRIQVQQEFLQAMLTKVCSTDTIIKNINGLVEVALEKSESDITVKEALKYVKYLNAIDPTAMTMDTIPGEGGGFFDMDVDGTKALINSRIYGIEPVQTEQNTTSGSQQE